jgi:hypothetical protein
MQKRRSRSIRIERKLREKTAHVRLGSYQFKQKGVSRFDLRDPYHLAVALTWPQFLTTLLVLYLAVTVVFAALFWLVPGSVANAGPTVSRSGGHPRRGNSSVACPGAQAASHEDVSDCRRRGREQSC